MEPPGPVAGPQARSDRVISRAFGDDLVIYDLATHRAHSLNRTAALVWQRCDGSSSISEIAESLTESTGTPVDEQMVWYALAQLDRDGLLEQPLQSPPTAGALSRKAMVQRLGITAAILAVPAVTTIVAPTAAMASTCVQSGQPCTTSAQCCSGVCQSSGTCL